MKINVNVYNEILSYEGTPAELAEFVSYGILDVEPEEFTEDCDCEEMGENVSYTLSDSYDEDYSCTEDPLCNEDCVIEYTVPDDRKEYTSTETLESINLEDYKTELRKELANMGLVVSDEEFDSAFKIVSEIFNFDSLLTK